ncbi:HlyD family efflux transporter periplasmic adaptor subunit [Oleispirillum naphthae]|uniref:HlyD family efflux transporter periplasmic adaptor subunit n=1 Tax=Oleispirillum naphthae TaxID=2838853 RepID=UPI0030823E50
MVKAPATAVADATVRQMPPPPRLRRDLSLYPAEPDHDGATAWTLHDAAANRFFRIGGVEADLLQLVDGSPAAHIAAEASRRFAHPTGEAEVETLFAFLRLHHLVEGDALQQNAFVTHVLRQPGPFARLLHGYISFKIPLLRPDRFLAATLPWVRWLGGRTTLTVILSMGLFGLFLASRQWDAFLSTFSRFLSLEGFAAYALTITAVKSLHELGHAYAAKAHGLRVPTIGVCFIVFWPVLYTDATDAWKLPRRRDRLTVGAAGIAVEFAIACIGLLLWNLLPDGPGRGIVFLLSTSTWILSLLVNLNPLMRFDGYFLFSDLIGEPNLESRAHAIGRWTLRRTLFGINDPPPETPRPLLRIFAFSIWIYRFTLYAGIALAVYHLFFKLAGIALFAVEVIYFLLAPILREFRHWWRRRREIGSNRKALRLVAVLLCGGAAFLFLPWRHSVTAPAVLDATYTPIYAPEGGILKRLAVRPGQVVAAGAPLGEIVAPQLAFTLMQTERRLAEMTIQRADLGVQQDLRLTLVTDARLQSQARVLQNLSEDAARLRLAAPHAGIVTDMEAGLSDADGRGDRWVQRGETLFAIVEPGAGILRAYVREEDMPRLKTGATARFFPGDGLYPPVSAVVSEIDETGMRALSDPYVSSTTGGPLQVHRDATGVETPAQAVYIVRLAPAPGAPPVARAMTGTAVITAERESFLAHFHRRLIALLQRESGF